MIHSCRLFTSRLLLRLGSVDHLAGSVYPPGMSIIAQQLDQTLSSLPAATAASVERLVWDVIHVVKPRPDAPEADRDAAIHAHQAHIARCLDSSAGLDWSDFERPPQGAAEIREDW